MLALQEIIFIIEMQSQWHPRGGLECDISVLHLLDSPQDCRSPHSGSTFFGGGWRVFPSRGIDAKASQEAFQDARGGTGSRSQSVPTPDVDEVREQVHEILSQIFALKVETMQEMGFIQETDRALARTLMSEFVWLQLIVGEDLNNSL